MADHFDITWTDGKKYRLPMNILGDAIAQKGQEVLPTPQESYGKALAPVGEKEWSDYMVKNSMTPISSQYPGVNLQSVGPMVRPIIDQFMKARCEALLAMP